MHTRTELGRHLWVTAAVLALMLGCRKEETQPAPQRTPPTQATPAPAAIPSDAPGPQFGGTPVAQTPPDPAKAAARAERLAKKGLPANSENLAGTAGESEDAQPPSIDEVNQIIVDRWNEIESVNAKIETRLEQRVGVVQRREGAGEYELLKKDGLELIRVQLRQAIKVKDPAGDEVLTGERSTTVFDGKHVYSLKEFHKRQEAFKTVRNAGLVPPIGGIYLLRVIFSNPTVNLDADVEDDGRSMYRYRCANPEEQIFIDFYVDQETGLLHRFQAIDRKVKSDQDFRLVDVKLDNPPSLDRFVFTPPEGLVVEDRTVQTPAPPPTIAAPKPDSEKTP